MAEQEKGKVFTVDLPSRGVLYLGEDGRSLLPGGKLMLRPMTTVEESILYAPQGDGLTKVRNLINNCVVDRSVDPDELLLVDRLHILLALRCASLGTEVEVPVRCAGCGQQFKHKADLIEDLDVQYMKDDVSEPFECSLPKCDERVTFRLLRGKDEKAISKHTKRFLLQSTDPGDPSYLFRIALQLIERNGEPFKNVTEAEEWVRTWDTGDSNQFRIETEAVEGGVDTTIMPDCRACGHTNELALPLTAEFFRPGSGRRRKS